MFLHTICIYTHMCLLIIVLTNHRPINIYYFCGYNQQYVRRSLNIKKLLTFLVVNVSGFAIDFCSCKLNIYGLLL